MLFLFDFYWLRSGLKDVMDRRVLKQRWIVQKIPSFSPEILFFWVEKSGEEVLRLVFPNRLLDCW